MACSRESAHGHLFDTLNLVNLPEVEARDGRQGQLAEQLDRLTHHCEIMRPGTRAGASGGTRKADPARRPLRHAKPKEPLGIRLTEGVKKDADWGSRKEAY